MSLSESNSREAMWMAEAEAPLEEMAPPLIGAVREPQYHSTLLRLEKSIQDFILKDDSQVITFPCFDTPYLTHVACILACHYGLEPASAENSLVFCKTAGTGMPLRTLSSIPPPVEPEEMGTLKKEEDHHTGLARAFDGQLKISSEVSPSPEQIPQPTPEAAQCPSASVTSQNQDRVDVPRPREDDDETGRLERPNFKSRSARLMKKLMARGQSRKNRRSS